VLGLVLALLAAGPPPFGALDDGLPHFRGALEAGPYTMPSGTPDGSPDFFGLLSPELSMNSSSNFELTLGADLRFRVIDQAPDQKANDFSGGLRREDWDERSDFGQIIQSLRIGPEGGTVVVRAGQIDSYTLGNGHLISRYSNRTDANYHPAGASIEVNGSAVRVQGFASDLLAARIFAADVRMDFARIFDLSPDAYDRYHLSVSALQDFGQGQLESPKVTALEIDPDAVVYKQDNQQVDVYLGLGTRIGQEDTPPLGAVIGARTDGIIHVTRFEGIIEVRKQEGRFRQGLVGPTYELARFSDIGLGQPSIADYQLPDGFSFYAQGKLDLADDQGKPWLTGSASGEHFTFGRTDLDARVQFHVPGEKAAGVLRLSAVGLGQIARVLVSGEIRYRFARSIYGLALAGTSFFPQPDHTLAHGFYGGFGAGVDFRN
jgi:hypothetical protein